MEVNRPSTKHTIAKQFLGGDFLEKVKQFSGWG